MDPRDSPGGPLYQVSYNRARNSVTVKQALIDVRGILYLDFFKFHSVSK